jgi:hypothetical protein
MARLAVGLIVHEMLPGVVVGRFFMIGDSL